MSSPGPRIACIGWGSLLWDPRTLPMATSFRVGGPRLPIEFSRVAKDGRVTLVCDSAAAEIDTYWCELAVGTLDSAISGLGVREKIGPSRWDEWIGVVSREASTGPAVTPPGVRAAVERFRAERDLDAVVWTALPSRRPDGVLGVPTLPDLVAHLASLSGPARERAEEYIRRAPSAVRTPHRFRFEQEFGWFASNLEANPPERDCASMDERS